MNIITAFLNQGELANSKKSRFKTQYDRGNTEPNPHACTPTHMLFVGKTHMFVLLGVVFILVVALKTGWVLLESFHGKK